MAVTAGRRGLVLNLKLPVCPREVCPDCYSLSQAQVRRTEVDKQILLNPIRLD
jgi:hypothetical protein